MLAGDRAHDTAEPRVRAFSCEGGTASRMQEAESSILTALSRAEAGNGIPGSLGVW